MSKICSQIHTLDQNLIRKKLDNRKEEPKNQQTELHIEKCKIPTNKNPKILFIWQIHLIYTHL